MSNFELIDDYLSNRLKGAEKEAFDKQLANDPSLKSDLDFQKQVVEGIRSARAAEIKTMLNNVQIGGAGVSAEFSVLRMAAGLIAAGVVGAAIYFYVVRGEGPPFNKAATDFNHKTEQQKPEEPAQQEQTPEATPAVPEDKKEEEPKKEAAPKQEEVKAAERPKLEVADPSKELATDNTKEESAGLRKIDVTPSQIQVEMDSSNKKYDFHYQFVGTKLMLYGSFDRSLYEVLEINGDNHAVFLFYKDAYYLLNEKQNRITKLEPITDATLVNKLKEYRKR